MPGERLLQGVYVPLVTPFAANGTVALDAVERLCNEYLDAGCAGIVVLGTTGESSSLEPDEQQAVIARCAAVCDERGAQLIVGAGTNNTQKTVSAVDGLRGVPAPTAPPLAVPSHAPPSAAVTV